MNQNQKEVVRYCRGQTMLGQAVVFVTDKGVCRLRLLGRESLPVVLRDMQAHYPHAELQEDSAAGRRAFRDVDAWLAGKIGPRDLKLDLHGTPFQLKVWREMLRVPHGATCSYTDLARRVGEPRAVRAVANACAHNPVGLLVPCHRIVRQDGSLGGYYWGLDKKEQLLAHERATGKARNRASYAVRPQRTR
jgi:AraC family transcriptional regulator, regulatory protein of adaptative response / methylated-DNA-[protein]-cysteine methyltransferase